MFKPRRVFTLFCLFILSLAGACGGDDSPSSMDGSFEGQVPQTNPNPTEPTSQEPGPIPSAAALAELMKGIFDAGKGMIPDTDKIENCAFFSDEEIVEGTSRNLPCEQGGSITLEVLRLTCQDSPYESNFIMAATNNNCFNDPEIMAFEGKIIFEVKDLPNQEEILVTSENFKKDGASYIFDFKVIPGEEQSECSGKVTVNGNELELAKDCTIIVN